MKCETKYLCCSERLLSNIEEIREIYECINSITWKEEFSYKYNNKVYCNQSAYNKAFEYKFGQFNWELQPLLYDNPKLIGDFRKNDIFIEVQFGNSASLYRDYYKFHYGLVHDLLSVAVLIVPFKAKDFFPTRKSSVSNMAEFNMAYKYFKLLPIPVPIMLVGLIPSN